MPVVMIDFQYNLLCVAVEYLRYYFNLFVDITEYMPLRGTVRLSMYDSLNMVVFNNVN